MLIDEEDYISHYGTPRHSGRYPWGSGDDGDELYNKRSKQFLDYDAELKAKGLTEKQRAEAHNMTIAQLRNERTLAKNAIRQSNVTMAQRLQNKGYSTNAIAKRMGEAESTVRTWLAPGAKDKANNIDSITNSLIKAVKQHEWVDVGKGVENIIGISTSKLNTVLTNLKNLGYEVHLVPSPQTTTQHKTNMKVLALPGTTQRDAFNNRDKIMLPIEHSDDGGRTFYGNHPPLKVNPKRIQVIYGEDGGGKADGMLYVRRGVKDIELGATNYAQVRVAVGDNHYLKGMAIYRDDLPDGVDIQFHTAKSDTGNKLDAMKKNSDDPDNPFNATIRQIVENKGTSKERVTSAMNIVNEEGNWTTWSRQLSSQFLSKQDPTLAQAQLDMTYERRHLNYEDIKSLTNATVRKKLLEDFAAEADSAAVHLKAAALPRQGTHAILPLSNIRPGEVYAPNYVNGERVVLIRHPHGGKFEIPELIVNNRNAEGRKLLGTNARDAIGIHHTVAQRLSGADFDGDTVLVIPNNDSKVKTEAALEGLKDFDPIAEFPGYPGMKVMRNTQTEMGKISNLITDMSLKGAPLHEVARAIRHSMVVIDAEKKELDYRRSYNDNNIAELKRKYQPEGGASTLISRKKARLDVPERILRPMSRGGPIDKQTGAVVFETTNRMRRNKKGELVPAQSRTTRLAETNDAMTLVSQHPHRMEILYARHSNKLKALANQARLDSVRTPTPKQSPTAKKVYEDEVKSLKSKLEIAKSNAPLERRANTIANNAVKVRKDFNPNMDKDTEKKIRYQELVKARNITGSDKKKIEITQEEWNAIQAGAVSHSMLNEILKNANMDTVHKLATPKDRVIMTPTAIDAARLMLDRGYTTAEVAAHFGVSISTIDKALHEGD